MQQLLFAARKVDRGERFAGAQFGDVSFGLLIFAGVAHERFEEGQLAFRLLNGLMGAGQVFIIFVETTHFILSVGLFQHVVTHKVIQPADLFDHHRLVEEFQRFF